MFYIGKKGAQAKKATPAAQKKGKPAAKKPAAKKGVPAKKPAAKPGAKAPVPPPAQNPGAVSAEPPPKPTTVKPAPKPAPPPPDAGVEAKPTKPVEPPKPAKPPPCHIQAIELCDKAGTPDARQAGSNKRLQIVPKPIDSWTLTLPFPPSKLEDAWNARKKEAGVVADRLDSYRSSPFGTFGEWARQREKHEAWAKATGPASAPPPTWDGGLTLSFSSGGTKAVRFHAKCSDANCKGPHPLHISGPGMGTRQALPSTKVLELAALFRSQPTVEVPADANTFKLEGRGCSGDPYTLSLDVLPSNQIAGNITFTSATFLRKFKRLDEWLKGHEKNVGDANTARGNNPGDWRPSRKPFAFSVSGAVKYLGGWEEVPKDWRAVYSHLIAAEVSASATASISFSAMQIGLGVPPSISDYLADVRLTIGVTGTVTLGGEMAAKLTAPTGSLVAITGKIQLKVSLGVPVSLEGFIGKTGTLGASLKAATTPQVSAVGAVERNIEKKWVASVTAQLDPIALDITATFDVPLVKKLSRSKTIAHWDLYPKTPLGTLGPWQLSS